MKNDCFGCNERSVSCHSTCEKYAAFRKKLEKQKKQCVPTAVSEYFWERDLEFWKSKLGRGGRF